MSVRPVPDPDAERDAGERTELAWSRSGLALLACFAILARKVWTSGARGGDVPALALLALASLGWAVGVGVGVRRQRATDPRPRQPAELLAAALGTVAVAAAGVVIAFVNI